MPAPLSTSQLDEIFRRGQDAKDFLNFKVLNSLYRRIRRLENISVAAPLQIEWTSNGAHISIDKFIPTIHFATIAPNGTTGPGKSPSDQWFSKPFNELRPYQDAVAYLNYCGISIAGGGNGLSQVWQPARREWVIDVFGISSQVGTKGIVIEHPVSEVPRLVFIPSPIGDGETTPNYDPTKRQALTHTGEGGDGEGGILRWIDIDNCESTSEEE